MSQDVQQTLEASERDFVISRIFGAPRARVYRAWVDARQMGTWWGPAFFTNPRSEIDARPGGRYRIVMRSPEGQDYPCLGRYERLVENEQLEMTIDCSEHPEEWFDQVFPGRDRSRGKPELVIPMSVTFEEARGETRLKVRLRFKDAALRDSMLKIGMREGWSQSLDKLNELVGGLRCVRLFDAPRDFVWRANTQSEQLAEWWTPKGFSWAGCKMDFQPGGSFHYCLNSPKGEELWGRFVYLNIQAPERVDYAVSFTDPEGKVIRHPLSPGWPLSIYNSLSLTACGDKTLAALCAYPINATDEERQTFELAREGVRQALNEVWDQLSDFLKKTKPEEEK